MATTKTVLMALGLVWSLLACGQTRQTPASSAQIAGVANQETPATARAASVIKPAGETRISVLLEPSLPWPSMRGVHTLMARNKGKFQRCFQGSRTGDVNVRGRLSVEFIIDTSGEIIDARVGRSTLGNQAVESCIVTVVRSIRFPSIPNGAPITVNYLFALTAPPPKNKSRIAPGTELAYICGPSF